MKKAGKYVILMALFSLFLFPALAMAETVEGTVMGLHCVMMGHKNCPVDLMDAVVQAESTFLVMSKDDKHYLIPNVDRAVLARYFNKDVKVTGKLDPKYSSIQAEKIEFGGKTVWSRELSKKAEAWMYGLGMPAQQ
jgi:hypothetical protein